MTVLGRSVAGTSDQRHKDSTHERIAAVALLSESDFSLHWHRRKGSGIKRQREYTKDNKNISKNATGCRDGHAKKHITHPYIQHKCKIKDTYPIPMVLDVCGKLMECTCLVFGGNPNDTQSRQNESR